MRLIDADAIDDVVNKLNEAMWGITRNEYKLFENVLENFPTIEERKADGKSWKEQKMVHTIKILKPYADAVAEGRKTFEVRLNDRGYNCGDLVRFSVFEDGIECRLHPLSSMTFRITYVHSGLGLQEGYVVFGIEKVEEGGETE